MSVLDEYIRELQTDTALDEFTMKDVQMKLPGIKHKWTGRLVRCKIDIAKLKRKRSQTIDRLTDKLIERSPVRMSVPVAKQKVQTLEEVIDLNDEIEDMKLSLEFCEKAERILNSMTFDIKNLTEIIKLETQ